MRGITGFNTFNPFGFTACVLHSSGFTVSVASIQCRVLYYPVGWTLDRSDFNRLHCSSFLAHEFPPNPPSARLALPARPKLLSEGGNRSGKDDFKFFFGGKF